MVKAVEDLMPPWFSWVAHAAKTEQSRQHQVCVDGVGLWDSKFSEKCDLGILVFQGVANRDEATVAPILNVMCHNLDAWGLL